MPHLEYAGHVGARSSAQRKSPIVCKVLVFGQEILVSILWDSLSFLAFTKYFFQYFLQKAHTQTQRLKAWAGEALTVMLSDD